MRLIKDETPALPSWVAATINRRVMTDFAFREAFEERRRDLNVEDVLHSALQSLALENAKSASAHIPALMLKSAVARVTETSRPTAEKVIENTQKKGLLEESNDPSDGRKVYRRLTVKAVHGLERYEQLLSEIAKVIEAQKSDPSNPIAGIELLSSEYVYFNVNDPNVVKEGRKMLADWMQKIKETSQ